MPKKKNSKDKSTNKNIDETKVYKTKSKKTGKKRKIPVKKIVIIEAKLDVQDLALKYENSVVVDKDRKCYCRA